MAPMDASKKLSKNKINGEQFSELSTQQLVDEQIMNGCRIVANFMQAFVFLLELQYF